MSKVLLYLYVLAALGVGENVLAAIGFSTLDSRAGLWVQLGPRIALLFGCVFATVISMRGVFKKSEARALYIILIFNVAFVAFGRTLHLAQFVKYFLEPFMLLFVLKSLLPSTSSVRLLVLSLFAIECAMAIYERIVEKNFFYFNEWNSTLVDATVSSSKSGFRSTALHGMPLENALIVLVIISFVAISSRLSTAKKYSLMAMGLLAIMSFNTRVPMVLAVLLILGSIGRDLRRKKSLLFRIGVAGALVIFAAGGGLLFTQGWSGRLVIDISDDQSAIARIALLEAMSQLSLGEWMWGLDAYARAAFLSGLDNSIVENFWLVYVLYYGSILVGLLTIVFIQSLSDFMRSYHKYALISISGAFIVSNSSSLSLATGAPILATLILCAYCFQDVQELDSKEITPCVGGHV